MSVVKQGRSLDDALQITSANSPKLDERDKGLYRALAYGVCRWYYALQTVIADYLKKPFKQKDLDLEVILLIGLYQIAMMKIDHHASVNETVKLTQWQNKGWAKGLVNAVLRGIIREGISMQRGFEEISYPAWIRSKLAKDWPEQRMQILQAGNQHAPMSLRLDIRQRSMESCLHYLRQQLITAVQHDVVETALLLDEPCHVEQLPGFSDGILSVQDPATQLAATLLDCRPGMRVLDACAAPGGKTVQILQSTDDLELIALDQHPSRLERVDENLKRAKRKAQLICGDASSPAEWFDGRFFDRILADVPCSASGVIRRHPDIKLLRRADDIDVLVKTQRRILSALWQLLKPGGLMVYSTCSIFKDENERQIDWFVQKYDNGSVSGPNSVQWGEQRLWGRQILPGSHNMDGFYYACLQKTAAYGQSG